MLRVPDSEGREMDRSRRRFVRVGVAWTLVMLAGAVLVAVEAMSSLRAGMDACFYTSARCPTGDDPAVARLAIAFFGVPAVWLVGVGLLMLAWSVRQRRW